MSIDKALPSLTRSIDHFVPRSNEPNMCRRDTRRPDAKAPGERAKGSKTAEGRDKLSHPIKPPTFLVESLRLHADKATRTNYRIICRPRDAFLQAINPSSRGGTVAAKSSYRHRQGTLSFSSGTVPHHLITIWAWTWRWALNGRFSCFHHGKRALTRIVIKPNSVVVCCVLQQHCCWN